MKSFYHYMMTFRGKENPDEESNLADWIFYDHSFPKQSKSYEEISRYLEGNAPFASALRTFDDIWDKYQLEELV
ncbi:YozE family protein [Pontibacillus salicampi]|uniref:UPF0346 protein ACFFGV_06460 n=1 Tax=Pontibacillus salicampi TaxID=1449801 RepID=A0ABV6LLK4_9BACI